jgi:hypothetical protein
MSIKIKSGFSSSAILSASLPFATLTTVCEVRFVIMIRCVSRVVSESSTSKIFFDPVAAGSGGIARVVLVDMDLRLTIAGFAKSFAQGKLHPPRGL